MSYSAHDNAVMHRINKWILSINKDFPTTALAQKIEFAWGLHIRTDRDKDPTSTIGRDADYYFAARKEVSNSTSLAMKVAKFAIGDPAFDLYAVWKLFAAALRHPEWARTDKDKPNAPVGGYSWMFRGALDGMSDTGDQILDISPHYFSWTTEILLQVKEDVIPNPLHRL